MSKFSRILIVEDEPNVAGMIELILNAGQFHNVDHADCAEQAYALLGLDKADDSATEPNYDVILLDIMMPEIDGIETCAQIRTNRRYRDTPILIISGMASTELVTQGLMAGAHDFLTKPVNRIELIARIHAALRVKRELDRRRAIEAQLKATIRAFEGRMRTGEAAASQHLASCLNQAVTNDGPHGLLGIRLVVPEEPLDQQHHAGICQEIWLQLGSIGCPLGWQGVAWTPDKYLIIAPGAGEAELALLVEQIVSAVEAAQILQGESTRAKTQPVLTFAWQTATGPELLGLLPQISHQLERGDSDVHVRQWLRRAA